MKINFEKLEKRLNEVQEKCTARVFDSEDIRKFVKDLESKRLEILNSPDRLERKYFQKVTGAMRYYVPNAYKWRADSTYISGYITRYGRIKIEIYRGSTSNRRYGGYNKNITPVYN